MAVRIFSHYLQLRQLLLGAAETVALFGSTYLAAFARFGRLNAYGHPFLSNFNYALLFAGIGVTCLISMGLYSARQRARTGAIVMRIAMALLVTVLLVAIVSYLLPILMYGRGWLALTGVFAFVLVAVIHVSFLHLVDESVFKRRVLVYGAGRLAVTVSQLRRRSDQRGFVIAGYVPIEGERQMVPEERVQKIGGSLLEFSRAHDVHEILVAMDDRRRAFPVHELLECRLGGIDVIDIVSFLERETGKIRLDVLNPGWLIFAEGFRRNNLRVVSERIFDIVTALTLLTVAAPVIALTALAIIIEDGWRAGVLYRQIRVGFEGREFAVLKLRSMRVDAEKDGEARWSEAGDRRVTRVGRIIRKVRIDELPQLINVLVGEMSFVGPRPERPEFVAKLSERIPYYRERHSVKPGITGWAQLCYPYGSSEKDATEKLQYDLYYVKNHSLLFDLTILVQTVEVVLLSKGGR